MVNYTTVCVYSAHIGLARIGAALVNACFVAGTLGIDRALGPTVWRSANVVDGARASGLVADRAALRVWTARRRNAWVNVVSFDGGCCARCALFLCFERRGRLWAAEDGCEEKNITSIMIVEMTAK